MPSAKFPLPAFLGGRVAEPVYLRWLARKARTHAKRDRAHFCAPVSISDYKERIHAAVVCSRGWDCYTGEELEWEKISTFRNADAKLRKASHKAEFALLPTVDHVDRQYGCRFAICGWRTNDAKGDLNTDEFRALCRRVLDFHEHGRGIEGA